MSQIEWIKLILEFIERNQVITAFIISMCIVGFALYVVMRATQRA
jgi:multisubunit Na+/H+ antiporter MnhC subunit